MSEIRVNGSLGRQLGSFSGQTTSAIASSHVVTVSPHPPLRRRRRDAGHPRARTIPPLGGRSCRTGSGTRHQSAARPSSRASAEASARRNRPFSSDTTAEFRGIMGGGATLGANGSIHAPSGFRRSSSRSAVTEARLHWRRGPRPAFSPQRPVILDDAGQLLDGQVPDPPRELPRDLREPRPHDPEVAILPMHRA
jgi:hypothetical protein